MRLRACVALLFQWVRSKEEEEQVEAAEDCLPGYLGIYDSSLDELIDSSTYCIRRHMRTRISLMTIPLEFCFPSFS